MNPPFKVVDLKIARFQFSPTTTIGMLYLNNTMFCFTLEDTIRRLEDINKDGDFDDENEGKVHGKTAIPSGTYKVVLSMSKRFGKILPEVLNVPGFKGVRIHSGNTAEHTEGCILVGTSYRKDTISESRVAMSRLMDILKDAEEITLTIK